MSSVDSGRSVSSVGSASPATAAFSGRRLRKVSPWTAQRRVTSPVCSDVTERLRRLPSTSTWDPFLRMRTAASARGPQKKTECHSVRSWYCPALSFQRSVVATERRVKGRLLALVLSSGSCPRNPISSTWFLYMAFSFFLSPSIGAPEGDGTELPSQAAHFRAGTRNPQGGQRPKQAAKVQGARCRPAAVPD